MESVVTVMRVFFMSWVLEFFFRSLNGERFIPDKDGQLQAPLSGDLVGIIIIAMLFIYMFLKLIMTFLFCHDKQDSIKLTVLKNKALPVCLCREAFRAWQIILMYMIPLVIMYAVLILIGLFAGGEPDFIIFKQFFQTCKCFCAFLRPLSLTACFTASINFLLYSISSLKSAISHGFSGNFSLNPCCV